MTVRVDAGPRIGGGHAMRCLTLADALRDQGAKTTFVTSAMPDTLAERITDAGHNLLRIAASSELNCDEDDWHEAVLSPDAQDADAQVTLAAAGPSEWMIVDHYLLDARWHSAARETARRILVIDDVANRDYDCDILLDQNFGRSEDNYRGRVPSQAKVLAGTGFALLRPEFVRERPAALKRRRAGVPANRILISIGTTDPDGIVAKLAAQVAAAVVEAAIDVVLAPHAPSLPRVEEMANGNDRVSLHIDSSRMAELMRDADIAIGACGATSWERCCLGLPALMLVLAGNQRPAAESLQRAGAARIVSADDLERPLVEWMGDRVERQRVAERAAAICDGEGTSRVLSAMLYGATAGGC